MPDTMKRFFGVGLTAAGDLLVSGALIDSTVENLFKVTTAHTYVIRHIHVMNSTGAAATLTIGIGTSGTAATNDAVAGSKWLDAFSIPAGNTYDWSGNLVMNADEYMYAKSGTDDVLAMTISGVDIT